MVKTVEKKGPLKRPKPKMPKRLVKTIKKTKTTKKTLKTAIKPHLFACVTGKREVAGDMKAKILGELRKIMALYQASSVKGKVMGY
jgi:hypothetical protein